MRLLPANTRICHITNGIHVTKFPDAVRVVRPNGTVNVTMTNLVNAAGQV